MVSSLKPEPPVIVIGGGAAGLSTALRLAESGIQVVVLEAGKLLGGRARSFTHSPTGVELDWGPHLFMAANPALRSLMARTGVADHVSFSPTLEVNYRSVELESPKRTRLFFPQSGGVLAQLRALLKWRGPGFWAKVNLLRGLSKIVSESRSKNPNESMQEMLSRFGQKKEAVLWFWEPFVRAVLNLPLEHGSAQLFKSVIHEAFAHGPKGAALGVPIKALGSLWAQGAAHNIRRLGGEVRLQQPALGLEVESGRIGGVVVREEGILRASAVVSAVPPDALERLLGEVLAEQAIFSSLGKLRPGPIVSAYCWLETPNAGPRFEALLHEDWDWLFRPETDTENLVCLLAGAVDSIAAAPRQAMESSARDCLSRIAHGSRIRDILVVRERAATWANGVDEQSWRLETNTPVAGFFLAGDWTQTGLPATVEGAVRSGDKAAEAVLGYLQAKK